MARKSPHLYADPSFNTPVPTAIKTNITTKLPGESDLKCCGKIACNVFAFESRNEAQYCFFDYWLTIPQNFL